MVGIECLLQPPQSLPMVEIATDASGIWFQVPWDTRASSLSIAAKEFVPIILACAAWGPLGLGQCDRHVVQALTKVRYIYKCESSISICTDCIYISRLHL